MLRNYWAAALRNLASSRFYAGISIIGLSVGVCAALLAALVIRNQLTTEHFIDGYERTYLAAAVLVPTGRPPMYDTASPSWIAALLRLKFKDIEAVTRITDQDVRLRSGQIEAKEKIYWADPNVFDVLPLPVSSGNLRTSLQRADGIAITRSIARKYFGGDDAVGRSMIVEGTHPMTVTAVIEDLPAGGTQLESGIFASGLASYSVLTQLDNDPANSPSSPGATLGGQTYLRIAPGASIERLRRAMPDFVKSVHPRLPPGLNATLELIRLDRVNLFPEFNPGIRNRLAVIGIVGALILLIACVVFVNLSTARSARRALEVGVRKVSGASRWALILQFIGESLIYVVLATGIAVALTELLLPYVNAFLSFGAVFDYWRDPKLIACLGLGVLTVTILAGAYPAFVLSAFAPISVLNKSMLQSGGAAVRQSLVALQFAILVVLLIAAAVVYRQRIYATQDALRVNADQVLIVRSPCNTAFETELRRLRGVRGAFCSGQSLLTGAEFGNYKMTDGGALAVGMVGVEFGVLDLYGLKPLAGRFVVPQDAGGLATGNTASRYVINETASRRLGFSSLDTAVGKAIPLSEGGEGAPALGAASEIIGVVPDFSINAVERTIAPSIYYALPVSHAEPHTQAFNVISVKLAGRDIPETLAAIERLWAATGGGAPLDRFFLSDYIQNLYIGMLREAQAFGVFSGVAVLLACLGLVGLSASATERRTKEIGIRKAMGAGTGDIVRLLLWQFIKPVIWGNAIAWPIAGFFMNRWLHGFAYHVDLEPWLFLAATSLALLSALITVGMQSYLVAKAKPIAALRYE
jgi:putative ABC transport system permease protein